jgi:cytochrome c1
LIATGENGQGQIWQKETHAVTTRQSAGLFRCAMLAALPLIIVACKPPPEDRQFMPMASAERGSKAIERVGCGSCHKIPGIDWPQGTVGPNLAGLAERGLIAGKLPNQPDILAAYIRDAPALDQGSGMPAMPISETEARDIAAYLYQAKDP